MSVKWVIVTQKGHDEGRAKEPNRVISLTCEQDKRAPARSVRSRAPRRQEAAEEGKLDKA